MGDAHCTAVPLFPNCAYAYSDKCAAYITKAKATAAARSPQTAGVIRRMRTVMGLLEQQCSLCSSEGCMVVRPPVQVLVVAGVR
jgi:hypothetical protein